MIMNLASITRIHNTVSAAAGMRRIIQLAKDYSTKRVAFGRRLQEVTSAGLRYTREGGMVSVAGSRCYPGRVGGGSSSGLLVVVGDGKTVGQGGGFHCY